MVPSGGGWCGRVVLRCGCRAGLGSIAGSSGSGAATGDTSCRWGVWDVLAMVMAGGCPAGRGWRAWRWSPAVWYGKLPQSYGRVFGVLFPDGFYAGGMGQRRGG